MLSIATAKIWKILCVGRDSMGIVQRKSTQIRLKYPELAKVKK